MNASGKRHPKRAKQWCPNGHRYTLDNLRFTSEKRWSKKKAEWVTYIARQCRICWRQVKRLSKRRKCGLL